MASATEATIDLQHLQGPRGLPWLGNLLQIKPTRIHEILERWTEQHGSSFKLRIANQSALVVSDWQLVSEILRARPETFRRASSLETVFSDLGMAGVLSAEGEQWQRQRKLTMRAFDPEHLRDYFPTLVAITERLRQRWLRAAKEEESIDIQSDLTCYSMDVTAGLAFGCEINTIEGHDRLLLRSLDQVFPVINRRLNSPVPYWRYLKLPSDRLLERNLVELRRKVDGFIADARKRMRERPELFTRPSNLIEAFLAVRDQPDSEFTDDDVYGNVFTTLLVGPDSTANVFAWATYFLSNDATARAALRAEADAQLGVRSLPDDFGDIGRLHYMDAVAQETMRLKPSGPILFLEARKDAQVGAVKVPAGTPILALTRLGGMSPDHFSGPERFDPSRWIESANADTPANASPAKRVVMPFGAGARLCPGRYLALVQIKMLGAMLARNFELAQVPGAPVQERFKFSMGPVHLRIKLKVRRW